MNDPVEPPRRGRPGHDQATVLRTAIELFNEQGYDGTSMGDLARELGFSKSAIYHHVPSKSHLLEQALDEALDGLTRALEAAASDESATAYERLRRAVHSSVEVLVQHLPAVTLLLRVRGNSEPELEALRRRRELDSRLATLVQGAVDEGALRSDLSPDLVGLDVRLAIAEHLARELGPRFEPPQLLRDKVAAGELGRKSGRGFYDW